MSEPIFSTSRLRIMLTYDEGCKKYVYNDTKGLLTVGIGHCITKHPETTKLLIGRELRRGDSVTESEIDVLFNHDLRNTYNGLDEYLPFWRDLLNEYHRLMMFNMCFQLGVKGLCSFKEFIAAIRVDDKNAMKCEIIDSKYYKQVPHRADRMIKLVNGIMPIEYEN